MARRAAALKQGSRALLFMTYCYASAVLVAVALTAVSVASLRADTLASACTRTYQPQTLDVTQPINLGQLKQQLYFYVCSGAYEGEVGRLLAEAKTYVETRASEVPRPALVLDIDETSLSNLPQLFANDFGYIRDVPCERMPQGPCGFDNWVVSAKAKAIDGTLALFQAAKARKVAVFFITGRHESEQVRNATAKNLESAGYAGWAGLVLRPASDHSASVVGFKSGERGKIAAQGYTIILNIGDQQSDLDGGFAERAYKLPNPFYYLP
jgi:acid phosphatase